MNLVVGLSYGLLAALCIAVGIVFRNGKGTSMLAGYNTMSDTEKARYDVSAWLKYLGNIALLVGVVTMMFGFITSFIDGVMVHMIYGAVVVAIGILGIALSRNGERFRIDKN